MNMKDCPRGPLEPVVGRLSDDLQRDHECGDFGRGLEGYPERALELEREIARLRELLAWTGLPREPTPYCPCKTQCDHVGNCLRRCQEAHSLGLGIGEPPNAALSGSGPKEHQETPWPVPAVRLNA